MSACPALMRSYGRVAHMLPSLVPSHSRAHIDARREVRTDCSHCKHGGMQDSCSYLSSSPISSFQTSGYRSMNSFISFLHESRLRFTTSTPARGLLKSEMQCEGRET